MRSRGWRLTAAICWTFTALMLAVADLLSTEHRWYHWLQVVTYALIGAVSWAVYVAQRRKDRAARDSRLAR